MANRSNLLTADSDNGPPIMAVDIPIVYEDEGQEHMGDTLFHYTSEEYTSASCRTLKAVRDFKRCRT